MPKTKVLEFQIGDIIQGKTHGNHVMIIIEKFDRSYTEPRDKQKHTYHAYSFTDNELYGIYCSINNKHYKILSGT